MKTGFGIFLILLISCKTQETKTQLKNELNSEFPYIIDSLSENSSFYYSVEMEHPSTEIEYIGEIKDSCELNDNFGKFYHSLFCLDVAKKKHPFKKSGLTIYANTTQHLTLNRYKYYVQVPANPSMKETSETEEKLVDQFVKSFPVFIKNPTRDTLLIETQDQAVFMIQEAKDEDGKWKPIEYWLHAFCGNSYADYKLPPMHIAVVKVVKYTGNFKTEMRLKLKNGTETIYSNIFEGSINKSQFDFPENISNEDKASINHVFLN